MSVMTGPQQVLLVNAYVRENAGDAALLSVCIDQVRRAFPGAGLQVAGMESPADRPEFEGIPNLGSARRWVADGDVDALRRNARRLLLLVLLGGYLLLPRRPRAGVRRIVPGEVGRELRAIASADTVVSIGGGYVHAPPGPNGLQNLLFVLLPIVVAVRERRAVAMMPQSFGPFRGRVRRRLVRSALCGASLVCAREEISLRALRECGVEGDRVVLAVDSGFALASVPSGATPGSPTRLRVGMTARQWLPDTQQRGYEQAMARVADRLADLGHEVVLIPQVTSGYLGDDDRIANRRIAELCRNRPEQVDDSTDYRRRVEEYDGLDLLVGTRFHSVIFALRAGVPCVAIAYEHKTRGIMRLLGLEEWVLDITDTVVGDQLDQLVERAVAERRDYAESLSRIIPPVVEESDAVVSLLRSASESRRCAS